MKAYKVELLIVDHDRLGADKIKSVIENQRYPNHCISPNVMDIKEEDIGEWEDSHPLNLFDKMKDEFDRMFNGK